MNAVSTKPYLIRAIYEWCVDQDLTPHIVVKVDTHVRVPAGYTRDGQIVLNLSPNATAQLQMGNEVITFQARFGGVTHSLYVPVANVLGIYAAQTGQGMAFEVIDLEDELFEDEEDESESAIPGQADAGDDGDDAPPDGTPPRQRPGFLKVVK